MEPSRQKQEGLHRSTRDTDKLWPTASYQTFWCVVSLSIFTSFAEFWRVKASQNTNELKCSVILHTQTSYKLFIIQLLFSLRIFFRSHFSYYFSSVHSCEDRLHFIYSPQCRYMIFTHFQSSFCSFLIRREKQSMHSRLVNKQVFFKVQNNQLSKQPYNIVGYLYSTRALFYSTLCSWIIG